MHQQFLLSNSIGDKLFSLKIERLLSFKLLLKQVLISFIKHLGNVIFRQPENVILLVHASLPVCLLIEYKLLTYLNRWILECLLVLPVDIAMRLGALLV